MAKMITITRPEVVTMIEEAAEKLGRGNKTEAVAMALRLLLAQRTRAGSLFGAHPGSVRVPAGVDLVAPAPDMEADAGKGGSPGRRSNDR